MKHSSTALPLVSIIMPSYNHAQYVREALMSVIVQTYPSIELIVIDDGSEDETPRIIEETLAEFARDMRVEFRTQGNVGLCTTLNRALDLAKGEFVQFLASDDAYLPMKTHHLVEELKNSSENVAAAYCDGFIVDEQSRRQKVFSDKFLEPLTNSIHRELIVGNWIPALGVLYRLKVIKELGGFDESLEFEDWDLLLRISKDHDIVKIPEKLFLYRQHNNNLSKNKILMKRGTEQIYEKHKSIKDFANFRRSIRELKFGIIFSLANSNNINLLFKWLLRRLQILKGISGGSVFGFLRLLFWLAIVRTSKRVRASFYGLRGIKIGKNCLFSSGLSISGNTIGVIIGDNVSLGRNVRVHLPRSAVPGNLIIGNNCNISDNSVIEVFSSEVVIIEDGCSIGQGAIIQSSGGIKIGRNTMIANYVGIYANNHATSRFDIPFNQQGYYFRGIEIGKNCWLGHGSVVVDGANLGANSIIGPTIVVRGKHEPRSRIVDSTP